MSAYGISKCIGVDPYNLTETGNVVSTVTTYVGQSTGTGPKVVVKKTPNIVAIDMGCGKSSSNITENLSPTITYTHGGEPVIGTIDASIYRKNSNQDNSKYIIMKTKRNEKMEAPNETLRKALGNGDVAIGAMNIAESLLRIVADGVMSIEEALKELGSIRNDIQSSMPQVTEEEEEEICVVRRLTPTETARLQGFPDDYTKIDGPETSDAPQFKAHGNSWATPCANFVSTRVDMELRRLGHEGTIRYATCCSGIEAHSISVRNLDWRSMFFSEIEPFPCRVLATHYPQTPNLGDMTQIHFDAEKGVITNSHKDGEKYSLPSCFKEAPIQEIPFNVGDLEVFSGGTPCFVAGTMVLTEGGYKPIEEVKVGERVITHLGRLRRVVAIGSKKADNIVAVTAASRQPIFCTADHKFWSAINPHQDFRRKSDTYLKVLFDGVEFREIAKVGVGGFVSQLNTYNLSGEQIIVPSIYKATIEDVIELAGWYVGDGHCRRWTGKNKKALILSLSESKVNQFKKAFGDRIEYSINPHGNDGVYRITVCSTELCDWLIKNFGEKSYNKTIPAWIIGGQKEIQDHFIAGYMATDGYSRPQSHIEKGASTTSYSLALGLADLFGKSCVCEASVAPTKTMYDGRVVNQRKFWTVKQHTNPNRFHKYGMWNMVRVRKIEPQNPNTVYNITVEEDHSYVVNGLCVKNCQSISIAGKREGMAEGSGTRSSLAFHYQRIIDETKPMFSLWENVCFGEDVLVTTQNGHKRISEVEVGAKVRSFDGKYHRVAKVMVNENRYTIKLTVMGAETIEVTPNHPFYARLDLHNKKNPSKREFSAPEWIPAGNLSISHYIGYRVDDEGTGSIGMANAYAVGRWLSDGSVVLRSEKTHTGKNGGQRARIFISTGYKKRVELAKELSQLPYRINESKVKDYAIDFTFTSDEFYKLIKDCGKGARNKRVPEYVFSLIPEEQKELLRGYLAGDGHEHHKGEMTYSSSSRDLALGIARLVRNVYHRGVSIRKIHGKGKVEICGRIVNARDSWACSFVPERIDDAEKTHLISFYENGFVWCPVRKIEEGDTQTVYNLSVEDTHTYEANDVVVHNCGAFSSNGGADFIWFVNRCAESGYAMAWRVLDAQYTMTEEFPRAVPQRRRRIWLVGFRENDWRIPARIVFELEKDLTANPPMRVPGLGFKQLSEEGRKRIDSGADSTASEHADEGNTLFGLVMESDDGRKDLLKVSKMIDFSEMPNEMDFAKVSMADIYAFAKKVGEPGYIGSVFRTDKKKKVKKVEDSIDLFAMMNGEVPKEEPKEVEIENDDKEWIGAEKITPAILENIGNAGILANGRICTLNCHEWTSGIQLSPKTYSAWEEIVKHKDWLKANDLLPEAYDETVCGLSDVLQDDPDEKYNLSWRACFGILRRAESRGKELPPALAIALVSTIRENAGIVKWIALNGRDTKKKETDLTEKESAMLCFQKFISSVVKFEDVEAMQPKRKAENDNDDEDEIDEDEVEVDEDGNPILNDDEGFGMSSSDCATKEIELDKMPDLPNGVINTSGGETAATLIASGDAAVGTTQDANVIAIKK